MTSLKGHVDRVDKFLIAGWAIDLESPAARPAIDILQASEVKVTLRPCFDAPTLRAALGVPGYAGRPVYAWRLWIPLGNGISVDVPFTVQFADTSQPLANGTNRVLGISDAISPEIQKEIRSTNLMFPSFRFDGSTLDLWVKLAVDVPGNHSLLAGNSEIYSNSQIASDPEVFGKSTFVFNFNLTESNLRSTGSNQILVQQNTAQPLGLDHDQISTPYTLSIPKSLFDRSLLRFSLPDLSNIVRVSGPNSDQTQYLIGGLTTFNQLSYLLERHAGISIFDCSTVVDWGVGCGRIARHFWETYATRPTPHVIGLDIDDVNVDWCCRNMDGFGDYRLLSLDGFDLDSDSVDFLYGISVMTHLSEHHQHLWLAEIRRILKPGAVAILSIHGEGLYGRQPSSIVLPFVGKFGFFDGIADNAIGEARSSYYRATYQSRSYIKSNWRQYFDLLSFSIMANAFGQDFVVVRRPHE